MTHSNRQQVLHLLKRKRCIDRPVPFVTTFEKYNPPLNKILRTKYSAPNGKISTKNTSSTVYASSTTSSPTTSSNTSSTTSSTIYLECKKFFIDAYRFSK